MLFRLTDLQGKIVYIHVMIWNIDCFEREKDMFKRNIYEEVYSYCI